MQILEAILFAAAEVIPAQLLTRTSGAHNAYEVRTWVEELNADYTRTGRAFHIVRIGDGYQMRTLPAYQHWVRQAKVLRPIRLSRSALEALAIIAYRQPIGRAEIERLRGVDSSSSLNNLLEKGLIRICGRDQGPGRALLYGTSRRFLSLFGLRSLQHLPAMDEHGAEPSEGETALLEEDSLTTQDLLDEGEASSGASR